MIQANTQSILLGHRSLPGPELQGQVLSSRSDLILQHLESCSDVCQRLGVVLVVEAVHWLPG